MKKLKYYLEFLALKILIEIVSPLSLKLNYLIIGEKLGDILYFCLPKIRKMAINNLNNAFPDKSNVEIKHIAKSTYRNFGKRMVEFIVLPRIKKKIMSLVDIEGLEYLEEIKGKKGAVILTAHIGSWHVMGLVISRKISPVHNIIRLQRNKMVDMLIKKQLHILGMKVIMEKDLKETIDSLRGGRLVEFLWDQDAGEKGIFCNFFKRPTSTSPGPIILAMRANVPIFFIIDVVENKRHKIIIEKPFYPNRQKNQREEIANISQTLTKYLEGYIRKYPDQWLWLHNRWATKPEGK